VRLPNAIANSACMIIALAAGAAALQSFAIVNLHDPNLSPAQGWWLALWLSPGATVGGWFGGRLTHRVPVDLLRYAFYALLVVTGLKLMLG
jgi:uncharacterized membrane protein YfcA